MKRMTLEQIELVVNISNQIEDLVACMVNLDGLAERVCDESGPLALQQLQHDMKMAIYHAARDVAASADPVVDPPEKCSKMQGCSACGGVGYADFHGCGFETKCGGCNHDCGLQ